MFINKILGKKINEGESRIIYENLYDPTLVIKKRKILPKLPGKYQRYMIDENYMEYLNYKNFTRIGLGHFLSPCFYVNGYVLMKKVEPLPPGNYSVPLLFSTSERSWGMLNDQLVCIDYDFLTYPASPIFKNKEKVIKSNYQNLYVFKDHLKYLKKIKKIHQLDRLPFNCVEIKNKFMLKKILDKRIELKI